MISYSFVCFKESNIRTFICEEKWEEEGKTFNPIRQSEAKAGKWNVVEVKFEKDKFWKRQIWKRQIWRQSTTFPRLQIRQTPHNRKKSKYWRQPSLGIWGEGCTGTLIQTLVDWYKTAGQLYSAQISVYGYLDSQVEVAVFFPAAVSMLSLSLQTNCALFLQMSLLKSRFRKRFCFLDVSCQICSTMVKLQLL